MSIPDEIYHGYYQRINDKYPDLDENTKWAEARKMIVDVLKAALKV